MEMNIGSQIDSTQKHLKQISLVVKFVIIAGYNAWNKIYKTKDIKDIAILVKYLIFLILTWSANDKAKVIAHLRKKSKFS